MKDFGLHKTILLVGPFNGVTQAALRTMTEFGSDIALVCDSAPNASRYTDGLNEARDIHPEYGRAAHFNLPVSTEKQIQEALGRVVESFGRMDVLIDASPLGWGLSTDAEVALAACKSLARAVLPFLLAKQKGRMAYVFEDDCIDSLGEPTLPTPVRHALFAHIADMARECRGQNVTVNGLSVGLTEDYVLKHFAKTGSIKRSVETLQAKHPKVKLVETTEAGLGLAYLAGPLSASLTGQVLRLTHGFHLER